MLNRFLINLLQDSVDQTNLICAASDRFNYNTCIHWEEKCPVRIRNDDIGLFLIYIVHIDTC